MQLKGMKNVVLCPNCAGFIDGTVIKIARPKGYRRQNVCYNGHKRSHALKVKKVTTPNGMFFVRQVPLKATDTTGHSTSEVV